MLRTWEMQNNALIVMIHGILSEENLLKPSLQLLIVKALAICFTCNFSAYLHNLFVFLYSFSLLSLISILTLHPYSHSIYLLKGSVVHRSLSLLIHVVNLKSCLQTSGF